MTVRLVALTTDVLDPVAAADFWEALLGWRRAGPGEVVPPYDGFALRFARTDVAKTVPHHAHLDLTSTTADDQAATVARVLALGGRHVDVGQRPEETHVVLGDPEGDELCVIAAGNAFLAGCGRVGAVACDGTREAGLFWSRAWEWPLVWDQDDETAVQAPGGGTKVTWGGYPPRPGPHRVRFEVEAVGDLDDAVGELEGLGATRLAGRPGDPGHPGRVVLADPDGCRFDVLRRGERDRVLAEGGRARGR